MIELLKGAGHFLWPLGACSVVAVFIIFERLVALRPGRIIPDYIVRGLIEGQVVSVDDGSTASRIIAFHREHRPDPEGLKAFAQLEISRMERGLFLLESVIGIATLIGLLGTVWGLVRVFASVDPTTGIPDSAPFAEGIALALVTTMIGLVIAIVAVIGNAFLNRRVDALAAKINVGVERLIDLARPGGPRPLEGAGTGAGETPRAERREAQA